MLRCFTFAEMGWVTRQLAATLFASPPSSTYDEVRFSSNVKSNLSMHHVKKGVGALPKPRSSKVQSSVMPVSVTCKLVFRAFPLEM